MNSTLQQAYNSAIYVVEAPDGEIVIRVGERSDALIHLLRSARITEWAFITAYNPGSEVLPRAENLRRNRVLESDLHSRGYSYYPGEGRSEDGSWQPERSFLILGIPETEATRLGKKFSQSAILVGGADGIPRLTMI